MEAAATTGTTTAKSFNAPESKLHFLDYWRIIRIRKTVILAVFLLVAITTTLVTFILPESFSSTVRMKVEKDAGVGGFEGRNVAPGFDPYWVQTEFETIQSKLILNQVITNLNLNRKWAEKMKVDELPTDLTYSILKRMTDVHQSRNTSLIEIRVISEDKNEAAVIANEIAKVYKITRVNKGLETARKGIATLEKEFSEKDEVVKKLQKQADELKEKLGISDIEAQAYGTSSTVEPETLRKIEMQRIEAQADYMQWHKLYVNLTNLSRPDLKKAVGIAVPDPQLATLLDQLATAEQKLAVDSIKLGAENPELLSTKNLLERIGQQVSDRLDGILEGLKTRTASLKAKLEGLEGEVNRAKTTDIATAIARRPYLQL